MVIVVLFAAIFFYAVLYLLYSASEQHLTSVQGWLNAIHAMIFLPENTIFGIFRLMILLVILYVVFDSIFSGAKNIKRRRRERKQREEDETTLKIKTTK